MSDLKLSGLPEFNADFIALNNKRVQDMLLHEITLIRKGKLRGEPLENFASTGDLSDCLKLYFDPMGGQKPRYRLVYREVHDGIELIGVQMIAVGKRERSEVYHTAVKRLGRA